MAAEITGVKIKSYQLFLSDLNRLAQAHGMKDMCLTLCLPEVDMATSAIVEALVDKNQDSPEFGILYLHLNVELEEKLGAASAGDHIPYKGRVDIELGDKKIIIRMDGEGEGRVTSHGFVGEDSSERYDSAVALLLQMLLNFAGEGAIDPTSASVRSALSAFVYELDQSEADLISSQQSKLLIAEKALDRAGAKRLGEWTPENTCIIRCEDGSKGIAQIVDDRVDIYSLQSRENI